MSYLTPFKGWLDIAKRDQYAFQSKLTQLLGRLSSGRYNETLGDYAHYLANLVNHFYSWTQEAFRDQDRLEKNIDYSLNRWHELTTIG